MSCLSMVQSVFQRQGITAPAAVVGSSDPQVIQMLGLLQEEGQELAARYEWQALTVETSFTTVATEIQTTLATTAPNMKLIINDTIWNRSLRRPVFGPLVPQDWQQQKAMFVTSPWNQFRIVGGSIKFIPVPTAGQSCFFEYITQNWATDITGVTGKSSFTVDTDVSLLDEQIMILGLLWRWKAIKGLNYAEDFAKYERRVLDAIGRDGTKPILNMGDVKYDILPGCWIPAGSWTV